MKRTDTMIHKKHFWYGIKKSVRKEVTNYNTCQPTKKSNFKYGKLPAKLFESLPQNKLFLYLILITTKKLFVYLIDIINLKNPYIILKSKEKNI